VKAFISLYRLQFCRSIIYMLQSTEYSVWPYLKWFWRTHNFGGVMYRRQLDDTKAARYLLMVLALGIYGQILFGISMAIVGYKEETSELISFGLALSLSAPVIWAHVIVLPVLLARVFLIAPKEYQRTLDMKGIFEAHRGYRIAVAGSYGKTTVKELLLTVLGEGKKVAATPANKNVTSSHAEFARSLSGNEEIVIIEFGEGKPGDVTKFTEYTLPTHAIITGIAPAHLDKYKTLDAAADDIFSVAAAVEDHNVFVNGDSIDAKTYCNENYEEYDHTGVLGWKVSGLKIAVTGMDFTVSKGSKKLKLHTGLIGEHLVGPLVLAVVLAKEFGLTDNQIVAGVARTRPHEHRMQPYALNGAWIIDDSYNGNLEGIRAGTALLATLSATRKLYVTPGLVDQGKETDAVHIEMGQLIARAKPDIVVLMQNSVTQYIKEGLEYANFKGEVRIEKQPLEFYGNLTHFLAAGDLLLMQNDWTDNYH
jgi:UDP-N-acetylmuramoyl-tripeptide--D-alanyl-D-alanine ligase